MRGQSIWRELPGSSICEFCAHRLGAARRPSHVQCRFLQSSRPASKPPAATAAVREENARSNEQCLPLDSIALSWGDDSQTAQTLQGGFGRLPAFASVNVPSSEPTMSGWSGPAFGTGRIELTEEEKQVRNLVNEAAERQQRRRINVYPEPEPQSNRAGRPIPPPHVREHLPRLHLRKRVSEIAAQRKGAVHDNPSISRHIIDDPSSNIYSGASMNAYSSQNSWGDNQPNVRVESWQQLRKRKNSEDQSSPGPEDLFSEGHAQREEKSKTARYTPLVRREGFGSGSEAEERELKSSSSDLVGEWRPRVFGLPAKSTRSESSSKIGVWQPRVFGLPAKGETFESCDERRIKPLVREVTKELNEYGNWGVVDPKSVRKPVGERPSDIVTPHRAAKLEKLVTITPSIRRIKLAEAISKDIAAPMAAATNIDKLETYRPPQVETGRDECQNRAAKHGAEETRSFEKKEDVPRGQGRDKMRRRQQFVQEHDEGEEIATDKAQLKRQRKREKAAKKAVAPTLILLPEYISVANLATALKIRVEDFIKKMEELGFENAGYDHVLNGENAGLIAMEYNFEPIIEQGESEDLKARPTANDLSGLPPKPPVVTIMGHVDHGKTTLLDWLRKSSVAATEHGGITQHIGAFSVPMPSGKMITFLDTPGHAAFLSMRQRGANVTDIVVLVVAADDSVKPQTIEAIHHAKTAKVPIIVAINKVDKDEANIDRVKQDLARHDVEIEDFGGDTQVVCVSGKTGQGMAELEEAVVTLSEILDLRGERHGQAEGWVLESSIKPMGKVSTVLVRRGTMRPGDFIVAGKTWARIRCLRNEAGVEVPEAGPGMPVEIDGWKEQPNAGDEVLQAPNESKAKSVVEYRLERAERDKLAEDMKAINEARRFEQERREREKLEAEVVEASLVEVPEQARGPKQVYFIIKGDVSGSVEAVLDNICSVGNAEVQAQILRSGVGQISEFDVEHAAAAGGCLINFNTPIDSNISRQAHVAKVKIIDHNVIYRLVDEVKATLSEHLTPMVTQRVLGEADVAAIFEITVKGRQTKAIAGCKVKNGTISKTARVRVLREGEVVFDGALESLKNVKKDVTEMRKGSECGMGFEGWSDFQVGDQIQTYEVKEEKRYL